MIKTGILGGETMAAGELIRILINHPDVDLRAVASDSLAGRSVEEVHRGLVGDVSMRIEPDLDPEGLDVAFLCGEQWMARNWMERHAAKCEEADVRVIDLTGAFRNGEMDMVYGFPEFNRKPLVRGATRASLPSPVAMAVELALFPLAKNMLLSGDISAAVRIASTESFGDRRDARGDASSASFEKVACSTRLDPIAPIENRPDGEDAAREVASLLRVVQPSFGGGLKLHVSCDRDTPRGIITEVDVPLITSLGELRRLFGEAYEDHNFTYPVENVPAVLDVANTNKCLVYIGYPADGEVAEDGRIVRITTVIDNLLKGAAGNAVHCLNLLFGLSERTGLALKASVY